MKLKDDLKSAMENRLEIAAQLSKNGLYFSPVHPTLDLSNYHIQNKEKRNTIINRVVDMGRRDGMGLDFLCSFNGHTEKKRIIIRTFSDPDIYVKNTSDGDIIPCYSNAILLYVNRPLEDKDGLVHWYRILDFPFIERQGWHWVKSKVKNNTNRLVLYNKNKPIRPSSFHRYSIEGSKDLFNPIPDVWDAIKQLFT